MLFRSTAIALILLLGATVKGALGVGMPLLSIPLLSLIMSPATAIGLLAAPILASNALQLYETRLFVFALRRIVWLMIFQYAALVWTIQWTTTIDVSELNRWTASSVFLSACLLLFKPQFQIPTSLEVPISILVGLLAGFMGGVSALTGPVVIAYLEIGRAHV